ncbi:MAG: FtsQ-type POTRA domain-containing protein [Christensenellaceae bacterium]|nr:FtsQ-type POTRA domain-containing protein [Christensenellaceae bacterium]
MNRDREKHNSTPGGNSGSIGGHSSLTRNRHTDELDMPSLGERNRRIQNGTDERQTIENRSKAGATSANIRDSHGASGAAHAKNNDARSKFWAAHINGSETNAASGTAHTKNGDSHNASGATHAKNGTATAASGTSSTKDNNSSKKRNVSRKKRKQMELDGGLDTTATESARGISHEEKRRRQNRRDAFQILFTFACVIAVIALGFLIYKLTLVDEIAITGSEGYSQAQILSISGIQKGDNIFLYDINDIIARVDAIPELSVVSVRRVFPNRIEIVVADHDAKAALLAANGTYTLIDSDGFVLSTGQTDSRGLPVIHGLTGIGFALNTYITEENLNIRTQTTLVLMSTIAESSLNGQVVSIDVANSSYVKLDLANDFVIILGDCSHAADNIATAAKAYALFLPDYPDGGTINVFFGSTVVDFTPNKIGTGVTNAPTNGTADPPESSMPSAEPSAAEEPSSGSPSNGIPSTDEPVPDMPATDAPATDEPTD